MMGSVRQWASHQDIGIEAWSVDLCCSRTAPVCWHK
jgi:hypothetical protein